MKRELWVACVLAIGIVCVACGSSGPSGAESGPRGDARGIQFSDGGGDSGRAGDGGGGKANDGGGGDSGSGGGLPYSGGTRIKAQYQQTTDGTLSFLGWKDAQIGIECAFAVAADGALRCLPSRIASAGNLYKDAACTQRMALYGATCVSPVRYIGFPDGATCPERKRIYALGKKLATMTGYSLSGSSCLETTFGTGMEFYDLGAEVAPATFAAATEQLGPDLGGIARADLVAADGARGWYRFVDTTRGATCLFSPAADGAERCLPSDTLVSQGMYANASCTTPIALRTKSPCPAPTSGTSFFSQGCDKVSRVYGLSGPASPYMKGTTCSAVSANPDSQYYGTGAEIPLATFPAAMLAVAPGTARVRAKMLSLPGTAPLPTKALRDTQRNEDCAFRTAADGATRCLPTSNAVVKLFSDALCTQRIVYRSSAGGCTTAPTTVLESDSATCRYHVHAVGAGLTPTTIYSKVDSTCMKTSISGVSFYALGAEIPASSFVEASLVER